MNVYEMCMYMYADIYRHKIGSTLLSERERELAYKWQRIQHTFVLTGTNYTVKNIVNNQI
jgi:hypothetical protein